VAVSDLDNQARQEFKVPQTVQGAVVTEVQPDSAAAEAGIKPGDIIESINRHPVKDAEQAVQLTENAKDKRTLLRIWSNGGSHYVVVDESQPG
jgi:serine protease Do